mgnify:FL=1
MMKWRSVKQPGNTDISALKRRIVRQGVLTVLALVMTLLLVFTGAVAWYTNVAQVQELTVQTDAWGFSGTVTLNGDTASRAGAVLAAAPGSDTPLSLVMTNDGDAPAKAFVTVDKSGLDAELQKRLYFYVDAAQTVQPQAVVSAEGETAQTPAEEPVARAWLHGGNPYAYTLLPKDRVDTEKTEGAAQLRCRWVYDLTGYYFTGSVAVKRNTETEELTAGEVTEKAYLRPVEYDYDTAQFDESGALTTVGEQTLAAFLTGLAETDGYPLAPDEGKPIRGADGSRFYLVQEGSGDAANVYLRLYGQKEIEAASDLDTAMANAAASGTENAELPKLTGTVKISVTGQQVRRADRTVSGAEELMAALEALQPAERIVLTEDIQLTTEQALTVADSDVTMELGGHTLTMQKPIVVTGGTLYLSNGKVVCPAGSTAAIQLKGGSVLLDGVTALNAEKLVELTVDAEHTSVRLRNCQPDTTA